MCGSVLLQSQSFLDAYRPFIPAAYLDSAEIVFIITSNLQAAAETDPELIYDFLRAFESEEQTFNTEQFRTYLLNFSEKRKKRSDWAKTELQRLNSSGLEQNFHRISNSFYNPMVLKDLPEQRQREEQAAPDTNKRDFFVYRYYSGDTSLRYDPAENFSARRNLFEYTFVDSFRNFCEEFTTDPDTTKCGRMVKKISDNWYMFDRTARTDPAPFSPSELVTLYVQQKYSYEEEYSRFGIGALYLRTSLHTLTLASMKPELGDVEMYLPLKVDQAGFTFFYRYRIEPVKTIFSYIKLDFSFLSAPRVQNGSLMRNLSWTYFFHKEISVTNISSLMMTAATPFLYITEDIHLELSTGISLNTISYRYQNSYGYRYWSYDYWGNPIVKTDITVYGDPNKINTVKKDRFLVSMSLIWNIIGDLNLQYSIGPRQATISVQQFF